MCDELVIFDCDGVLIDSEPIANRVFADQLACLGLYMSCDEVMRRFVGRTREGCLALAAELLGRDLPEGFAGSWDAALFAALGNEVRYSNADELAAQGATVFRDMSTLSTLLR